MGEAIEIGHSLTGVKLGGFAARTPTSGIFTEQLLD
jgi:hypothetical protein